MPLPNDLDVSLIDYVGPFESAYGIEVMMARCIVIAHHYKGLMLKGMECEARIKALESKVEGLLRFKS